MKSEQEVIQELVDNARENLHEAIISPDVKFEGDLYDKVAIFGCDVYTNLIENNFIRGNLTRVSDNRLITEQILLNIIDVMLNIREEYNGELTHENINEPIEDFSDGIFGIEVFYILKSERLI